MQILCVVDEIPWPAVTGYRLRIQQVLAGLAQLGAVDLLVVADTPPGALGDPPVPLRSVRVITVAPARRTLSTYARWALGSTPRTMAGRDWGEVRTTLPPLVRDLEPDVVWWSHADVYRQVYRQVPYPSIVDLDNLDHVRIADLRTARRDDARIVGRPGHELTARDVLDRADERRWRRLQRRVVATASTTVVCSELDRARLGEPGVAVIPNGYDVPAGLVRHPDPATVTMIALYTYPPNHDGAEYFVRSVLPHLRTLRPDVEVRFVGRHDGLLDDLAGPGVTVTGEVADLRPELARATVAAVPLRSGAGTRLKVIEAFACGIPVVSTSRGAEGLGAHDGTELLLADNPVSFAHRVAETIADPAAAAARSDAAHRLWAAELSGTRMAGRVADLADRVARTTPERAA